MDAVPAVPKHMKISELSAHAKIPVTTIRYYLRQGLLPPPLKTAKTMAYYTPDHLKRLGEIQRMKEEKHISLEAIKEILADGEDEDRTLVKEKFVPKYTQTREEIIQATVKLFREKGYDGVTIGDIASAAKVGKSTFYQYFKNKEEIFWACIDAVFEDIGRDISDLQMETDGLKRLWIRGRHFNPYAGNFIELLSLARGKSQFFGKDFQEKAERAFHNFIEPIQREMGRIIEQHRLPLKNALLLAYLLMGAVEYSYYYLLNYNRTIEEINEDFWLNFFGGLPENIALNG